MFKSDAELPTDLVQLLAHHWKNAGDEGIADDDTSGPKALRYIQLAGDIALRHCVVGEAIELYQEAVEIAKKSKKPGLFVGPLQRRLGECHLLRNDLEKAGKQLNAAVMSIGGDPVQPSSISEKELSFMPCRTLMMPCRTPMPCG